jgi:hypothetical protein
VFRGELLVDAPRVAGQEELLKTLVPEGLDHGEL